MSIQEIGIIVGVGLGLLLLARIAYSVGYGAGFNAGRDHEQNRFIRRIEASAKTRDGEPEVFRG